MTTEPARRNVSLSSVSREILAGTLISVIVGIAVWFFVHDLTLAFMITLISECVALLLGIRINLEDRTGLLLDAISLSEEVASSDELRHLISDYSDVLSQGMHIFKSRANELVVETAEIMAGLRRGHMTIRGLLAAYMKGYHIIQSLHRGGIASAIVNKEDDWSSGEINVYHKMNLQVARAGLDITRVFILRDPEFIRRDSPLFQIMKEQHDSGIKLYYVRFDELDSSLVRDVGFWDEEIVVNMYYSSTGALDIVTYDTSPTTIRETKEYFERLVSRSHPASTLFGTQDEQRSKRT